MKVSADMSAFIKSGWQYQGHIFPPKVSAADFAAALAREYFGHHDVPVNLK